MHYAGLRIADASAAWQVYEALTPRQLAKLLLQIAGKIDLRKMRMHPRGPKVAKKKGYVSGKEARKHVSTARMLQRRCKFFCVQGDVDFSTAPLAAPYQEQERAARW